MGLCLPAGGTEPLLALYTLNLVGARVDFCNFSHNRVPGTLLTTCVRHFGQPKKSAHMHIGMSSLLFVTELSKTILWHMDSQTCLSEFSVLLLS